MAETLLVMDNISKSFGMVNALKHINFNLKAGEVHALVGENGAGKSTLMRVLGGIYAPDTGFIHIEGIKQNISSIKKAFEAGISIIHQEILLVPYISITENIFLGKELRNSFGFKDTGKMNEKASDMARRLGIYVDVTTPVYKLSIARQQLVEIIKAVSFEAGIIVMDEPTSSLTETETRQLFEIIRNLKRNNIGIIYISHKMDEIFEISDRITVMRDGEIAGTKDTGKTGADEIIGMMVGRELSQFYIHRNHTTDRKVLEIQGFTRKPYFDHASFYVRQGEIIGFAGLVGAGRSELIQSVLGIDKHETGEIILNGRSVVFKNYRQAIEHECVLVSEDRKKYGLIPNHTVGFNITLAVLKKFMFGFHVDRKKKDSMVEEYVNKLHIKTPSADTAVGKLSGGNQQKVVLAKWLATAPKVLVLDEPTRGIDIAAKKEIYELMDKLAEKGMAIILISSELPELINMSDRVYIMREGKITGELKEEDISQKKIMEYATGGRDDAGKEEI